MSNWGTEISLNNAYQPVFLGVGNARLSFKYERSIGSIAFNVLFFVLCVNNGRRCIPCGLGLLGFLWKHETMLHSIDDSFSVWISYHLGFTLLSDCKTAAVLLLRVEAILIEETKIGDDRPLWWDEEVIFARLIRHGRAEFLRPAVMTRITIITVKWEFKGDFSIFF